MTYNPQSTGWNNTIQATEAPISTVPFQMPEQMFSLHLCSVSKVAWLTSLGRWFQSCSAASSPVQSLQHARKELWAAPLQLISRQGEAQMDLQGKTTEWHLPPRVFPQSFTRAKLYTVLNVSILCFLNSSNIGWRMGTGRDYLTFPSMLWSQQKLYLEESFHSLQRKLSSLGEQENQGCHFYQYYHTALKGYTIFLIILPLPTAAT